MNTQAEERDRMVGNLVFGAFGLVIGWVFLYSVIYVGVKHALRDHVAEAGDSVHTG